MDAPPSTAPSGDRHPAEFLDGWSLAVTPVVVELTASHLRILDEAGRPLRSWDAVGLRGDAMQEGGVLHVTHVSSDHETLVIRDAQVAGRVLAMCSSVQALPGGRHKFRFALGCLALLGAIAGAAHYAAPLVARAVAHRVPLEEERALGAQIETLLDRTVCADEAAGAVLERLERELAPDLDAHVEVRIIGGDEPNAFALPGGIVLLTDGLLQQADGPDEIAGVLAHELEHVAQRHVLAGFIRDALFAGLWAITVGDYAGLFVVDPATAYHVANLQFSRDDEAAADAGAVRRLHRAGLSHRGIARFFERVQAKYGGDDVSWLSTHPATRERLAAMQRIPDLTAPRPALTPDALATLRAACAKKP